MLLALRGVFFRAETRNQLSLGWEAIPVQGWSPMLPAANTGAAPGGITGEHFINRAIQPSLTALSPLL